VKQSAGYEKALALTQTEDFALLMKKVDGALPDKVTYRDYAEGLLQNDLHIMEHLAEVWRCETTERSSSRILDVGPGVGCFMLLAREYGNKVFGIDLPTSSGAWIGAYKDITDHLNLGVRYEGFSKYLRGAEIPEGMRSLDLLHFRGSLDGVLGHLKEKTTMMHEEVSIFLNTCARFLKPGGDLWIAHNADSFSRRIADRMEEMPTPFRKPVYGGYPQENRSWQLRRMKL